VLPPPGLGAARPLALVLRVDLRDLLLGPGFDLDLVVLAPLLRLLALGADHQPVLTGEDLFVVAEHLRRPLVDSTLRELALLVEDADERVAAVDAPARPQGRPPFAGAGRVEGVDAAQRVAPHHVLVLGRDGLHLVLADERVATGERGRRDRAAPAGARRV